MSPTLRGSVARWAECSNALPVRLVSLLMSHSAQLDFLAVRGAFGFRCSREVKPYGKDIALKSRCALVRRGKESAGNVGDDGASHDPAGTARRVSGYTQRRTSPLDMHKCRAIVAGT
jgi:hypothetical protein